MARAPPPQYIRSVRRRLAFALLALAACGSSKQRQLNEQERALCEGLRTGVAAPPANTVRDAANAFGRLFDVFETGTYVPLSGDDVCPSATLRRRFWGWTFSDGSLCGPSGCTSICEVRSVAMSGEDLINDLPICARQYLEKQPP